MRVLGAALIVACASACGAAASPSSVPPAPFVPTLAVTAPAPAAAPTLPPAGALPAQASRAAWPDCAALAGTKIELPSDFAPGVPFPADVRFIRFASETSGQLTQLRIVGITPLALRDADVYLQAGLVSARYRLTSHDTEQNEADGLFMGNGWIGSYQVRPFEDCAQATIWTVQVLKL
jgi:hypothetical protein